MGIKRLVFTDCCPHCEKPVTPVPAHLEQAAEQQNDLLAEANLRLPDMVCGRCAAKITSRLWRLDGVEGVLFDLKHKQVRVFYAAERVPEGHLRASLKEIGFSCS